MNIATTQAPPAFIGWWRSRKGVAWTRLCDGPDHDTTQTRLIEALSSVRGGDTVITRADVNPNAPPKKYAGGGRQML